VPLAPHRGMIDSIYLLNLVVNGMVEGLIVALLALSLTLVFGIARFPNAATGDFATLGAYAAYGAQVSAGLPLGLAVALGAMATACVAVVFHLWIYRRLSPRALVARLVASIGVAFLVRSLLTLFLGYDQRNFDLPIVRAMNFGGVRILPTDLWIAAAAVAALAVVFAILHLTPIGRRMRAVADDPDLARASGIRAGRVLVVLWLMAGAVAGLAGALIGMKSVVAPEMGWELLLPAFAATILGGIGSPAGAVIGGLLLGIAQEVSTPFVGFSYKIALAFGVLLAVLLARPQGLFGRAALVR